jgi:hypothetical protein
MHVVCLSDNLQDMIARQEAASDIFRRRCPAGQVSYGIYDKG